jgi:hypothetical protein
MYFMSTGHMCCKENIPQALRGQTTEAYYVRTVRLCTVQDYSMLVERRGDTFKVSRRTGMKR